MGFRDKTNYKHMRNTIHILLFFFPLGLLAQENDFKWFDPDVSFEERADALVKAMTLEEKIAQMCQYVGIEHIKHAQRKNKNKMEDANAHPNMD